MVAPYSGAMLAMVARSTTARARRARPVKFDKFSHHFGGAQHLRDGQSEVRRGHARAQRSCQMHPNHVGREKINRLAQHARLRFDAAHPPADDAQAVDHRGVGIGPDKRVRIINRRLPAAEDSLGQIFQVDLMDDANAGRHDFERVKGLHAPFEKLIALAVAMKFHVQVPRQRVGRPGEIHLDGMVHHQIHRHQRLDDPGVLAQLRRRRAHGRQIDQQRNAGKILQDNSGDNEGNFLRCAPLWAAIGPTAARCFPKFFCRRNCAGLIRGQCGWKPAVGRSCPPPPFPKRAKNNRRLFFRSPSQNP